MAQRQVMNTRNFLKTLGLSLFGINCWPFKIFGNNIRSFNLSELYRNFESKDNYCIYLLNKEQPFEVCIFFGDFPKLNFKSNEIIYIQNDIHDSYPNTGHYLISVKFCYNKK